MTADNILLTTSVGSFGKPDYLQKARNSHARGKVSDAQLIELERKATAEWIRIQEDIGLDILVDGEMYRGDMVAYFADLIDGYTEGGLVRCTAMLLPQARHLGKPATEADDGRVVPLRAAHPEAGEGDAHWSPMMLDWSYNEGIRRAVTRARARGGRAAGAEDPDNAGAQYIQIDEPPSSAAAALEVAIEAMGIVTQNLKAKTISQIVTATLPRSSGHPRSAS
jgi:5-methyltetrahydropteroyltriglutamate--homocysteine methyltransferase